MKNKLFKSMAMQTRAKRRIPGMTQLLSKRPDMFSLGVWPGYFSKARGAYLWDLDGNKYLDMSIAGIGANVLSYADPDVDEAVKRAIADGTSSSLNCPEEVELAELFCELHPWAEMVRYTRSGGEAMTVAVRIARAHTGKDKVAFCGYHGWHDWYLAANLSAQNALGDHLLPGLNPAGVPRGLMDTAFPFHYNQLEELEGIVAAHGPELSAVVMEPIRNMEPQPGFMEGVRALADEVKAVLIMDEISSGFRLTTGGAHLVLGNVAPDIAVFSKALGNGYPIAAVIGTTSVMEAAQTSFISSTNWTERIGPTAAIATIKKHLKENVAAHLVQLGQKVQQGWSEIAQQYGISIHVGGMKPMSHFSFEGEHNNALKAYLIQLMLEQGFLASNLYYAMYAHTDEHVQAYLNAMGCAFAGLSDALQKGDLIERLDGQVAQNGFKRLN